MSTANVSGSDDQMDIEEDDQPADPLFQKNQQTMFNRPPPKIFGQNSMPPNDFTNKDNNRGSNFDDVSNIGNSNIDRENDMDFGRGRGADRERDRESRNIRGNRRDYSNERGGSGSGGSSGRNSNNSRWSNERGRSRENDRITPSDGNSRDFSRNNSQWRDSQPNFNNSFMDQPNPRMNISSGPPPALEDMRLPIPLDNMRGGPMGGPNGKFHFDQKSISPNDAKTNSI